jgi:hypothetical protein
MRDIGNPQRNIVEPLFNRAKYRFALRNPFAKLLHGCDGSVCRLFVPFQLGYFVGPFLEIGSQLLHLNGQGAPLLDQFAQGVPLNVPTTGAEPSFDAV